MSEIFPLENLIFNDFSEKNDSSNNFWGAEGGYMVYQSHEWGMSKDINSFCSNLRYEDNNAEEKILLWGIKQEQSMEMFSELKGLDGSFMNIISPPRLCQEVRTLSGSQYESSNHSGSPESTCTIPSPALEILNSYGSRCSILHGEKESACSYYTAQAKAGTRTLSTYEILWLAGEKFIQSCSQRYDDLLLLIRPVSSSFSCLTNEETKDVELVQFILISAEKVGRQQFDCASKLLDLCDELSSPQGNPVERLVYYLSKALREKICCETGGIPSNCLNNNQSFDVKEAMMSPNPTVISFHKDVPFSQVSQFIGVQVIVENVAEAKKVHIIDLEIRSGMQCMILMQALATRSQKPLEHFKVTAIGTKSKEKIEETGDRLMSFALSMNISFSFNVVMVADVQDLNKNQFMLDSEEAVAVVSSYFLWTLLSSPSQLECLMEVIRKINPCVMVITEVEAKHNSPVFVNRFTEALFFYGVFFDAVEDCMDRENPNRFITESMFLNQGIRTVVAAEGDQRTIRHVSISVWRAFFARFGMAENELSMSSLYQASLVLKNFACGNSCTLVRDGKGLIIGWKGTPVHSLTTWKFL